MIVNTYPISHDQPVPDFVRNFYADLRQLLIKSKEVHVDSQSAVDHLMKKNNLNASISLNTVTVDKWGHENKEKYIILCWQDQFDQYAFIKHYSTKPTPSLSNAKAYCH